jgi:hypothetical protein
VSEDRDVLLARIDERVEMILKALPTYATCERVDAVMDKAQHAYAKAASVHDEISKHMDNHQSMSVNRNLVIGSYLGGLGAIVAALYAIFSRKGP